MPRQNNLCQTMTQNKRFCKNYRQHHLDVCHIHKSQKKIFKTVWRFVTLVTFVTLVIIFTSVYTGLMKNVHEIESYLETIDIIQRTTLSIVQSTFEKYLS